MLIRILCSIALLSLAGASSAEAQLEEVSAAASSVAPGPANDGGVVVYRHEDCANPAADPGGHAHTEPAPGFRFNGGDITFAVIPRAMFPNGIPCPIPLFTGAYNIEAKCGAGTTNPGTRYFKVRHDFVGGELKKTQHFAGNSCVKPAGGDLFTLDVTVDLKPVPVDSNSGASSPPAGGVVLEVSQ